VVSTQLKKIGQFGTFPLVGMKIKSIRNHNPVNIVEAYETFKSKFACSKKNAMQPIYVHNTQHTEDHTNILFKVSSPMFFTVIQKKLPTFL